MKPRLRRRRVTTAPGYCGRAPLYRRRRWRCNSSVCGKSSSGFARASRCWKPGRSIISVTRRFAATCSVRSWPCCCVTSCKHAWPPTARFWSGRMSWTIWSACSTWRWSRTASVSGSARNCRGVAVRCSEPSGWPSRQPCNNCLEARGRRRTDYLPRKGNIVPRAIVKFLTCYDDSRYGIKVSKMSLILGCQTYDSRWWATYRQWQDLGGQVRRGEHGTRIVFWKPIAKEVITDLGETETEEFLLLREYTVFNVEQVEGKALDRFRVQPGRGSNKEFADFGPAEQAIQATKARILFGGNKAFYRHDEDFIQLPAKSAFASEIAYYSTLAHEV